MSRAGKAAYGSQSAMARNALLTWSLSVILTLIGIAMIFSGITKGWICIGLAAAYSAFIFFAMRSKKRSISR